MSDYIHGPGLCAWLEQRGYTANGGGMTEHRRGRPFTCWSADFHCVQAGRHLSEVPDELWRDSESWEPEIDEDEIRRAIIASAMWDGVYPARAALRWKLDIQKIERWLLDAGIVLPMASTKRRVGAR